ncbi:serine hydrolase [Mucilaginibacter sp. UR6-11]|uniref:serine hydrolase domain-containing protein n=1 Tax=Mucilaginibacter sp. UR6-11 TaxID=1435644 RepID=UPI001E4D68D9|nr:serine hydrolase domain-containing protein [Mucilaginibacter sp. UR6-11]MCC8424680.1 beta-lactamase family protein [Mucilaginibacter sp. UR6-11]
MKKLVLAFALFALCANVFAQSSETGKFIEAFTKKNNFNGTILIEQNSKTIYKKSFGFANLPFKVPTTTDTKYKVASITKAFTSVLILQLVEQGKIDLEKPITTYLPAYKGAGGIKVTIKQLLNMTSGMRNFDENGASLDSVLRNGIPQYQLPFTSDQLLTKFCSYPLVKEPGKEFDYNNADFIILGKVIEKISGKSYEQNLQEKIFQPLQMASSGLLSQNKIIDKLADTYFYRGDLKALVNDLPVYMENWYAAGAIYSTADDILKFSNALFSGRLLKQETMNQMFTSGLGEYGLGVWVYLKYEINHKMFTIVKRPGSIMGAQAMLFHILEDGSTIIILSNTGTVSLDDFAADIARQIIK